MLGEGASKGEEELRCLSCYLEVEHCVVRGIYTITGLGCFPFYVRRKVTKQQNTFFPLGLSMESALPSSAAGQWPGGQVLCRTSVFFLFACSFLILCN